MQFSKLQSRKVFRFLVAMSLADATSAFAGSWFKGVPEWLEQTWTSHEGMASNVLSRSFEGLSADAVGSGSVFARLRSHLGERGLHPLIRLTAKPSSRDDGHLPGGRSGVEIFSTKEFSLRAGSHEICKANVRVVESESGYVHVMGTLPTVNAVYEFSDDAFETQDEAAEKAFSAIAEYMDRRHGSILGTVTSASKCLFPHQGELIPAWQLIVKVGSIPFQMFVGSDGVIEGSPYAFDISAQVRAYDPNPANGTLKNFSVTVNGDGYMANEYFTTSIGTTGAGMRLQSGSQSFTTDPGSNYFAEQSSFAHVNQHFDFVSASGYVWKGPKPLTVKTQYVFTGGNINNAQYTPFDGQTGPHIMMANGDGSVLQNLPFDSDVVSHEFGHHVVFSAVTTTLGESLVLHEGLADAITFMRTGDACLGESICPSASTLCQVKGSCLRTASNSMKYRDATYTAFSGKAHLQGQVVSGLIWDLRKNGGIPQAELNRLLLGTINYLPDSADIKAFVTALLDADLTMFNKEYQSLIVTAAENRGMSLQTLGITLDTIDGAKPGAVEEATTSKSKKGFLGLCSIGDSSSPHKSSWWFILLLLSAPILIHRFKFSV